MPHIKFDELVEFNEVLEKMTADVDTLITEALTDISLQVLQKAKENTPIGWFGDLKEGYRITDVKRSGNEFLVELTNEEDYAVPMEFGHNQEQRFVPGKWYGDKFKYIKGWHNNEGMMLREQRVEGRFMVSLAMTDVSENLDKSLVPHFEDWLWRNGWKNVK